MEPSSSLVPASNSRASFSVTAPTMALIRNRTCSWRLTPVGGFTGRRSRGETHLEFAAGAGLTADCRIAGPMRRRGSSERGRQFSCNQLCCWSCRPGRVAVRRPGRRHRSWCRCPSGRKGWKQWALVRSAAGRSGAWHYSFSLTGEKCSRWPSWRVRAVENLNYFVLKDLIPYGAGKYTLWRKLQSD